MEIYSALMTLFVACFLIGLPLGFWSESRRWQLTGVWLIIAGYCGAAWTILGGLVVLL